MNVFKTVLGALGDLLGVGSVGDAAKALLDAIKADPKLEAQIREIELSKFKMEMEENKSVRELLGLEIKSEDKFVRRARPAMLWLVLGILTLNFGVLPIFNTINQMAGGMAITIEYADLPENIYWLIGTIFSVYTGARSWDKTGKKKG